MATLTGMIIRMFTPDSFCQLLGISRRTYRRWQQDINTVPRPVLLWLHVRRCHLDQFHEDWNGWHINLKTGELVSPYGVAFSPSQIEHMNMAFNERDILRLENKHLRSRTLKRNGQHDKQETAEIIQFPKIAK